MGNPVSHADPVRILDRGRSACQSPTFSISFQPRPIGLTVCHTANAAGVTTSIMRTWADGDARRCRLCPSDECSVNAAGCCLVAVPDDIPGSDAVDFSLRDWRARHGLAGPGVELPPHGTAS